jgi:hypothetical protein
VSEATIRILIADDQALMRTGFRMFLDAQDDMEGVGEAIDGADAIRRFESSHRTSSPWTFGCRRWTGSRRPGASRRSA